jgi:hypothetical protein
MRAETLKRPVLLALMSAALIGLFFVLREHWGHALGLAPYLLLLACPLMHLFHHSGHGHGEAAHRAAELADPAVPSPPDRPPA